MVDRPRPQDRLQPALLDRLTDHEPGRKTEPVEARVLSKARLRQSVLRDLEWLFSTTCFENSADPSTDLSRAPYVRASVVNFGLPPLSGRGVSSLDVTELARSIREAVVNYEPRILPATLTVRTLLEPGQLDHHNVVGVEIRGHLWAQPVPLEFLVRTTFNLETGIVKVSDLAAPRVA